MQTTRRTASIESLHVARRRDFSTPSTGAAGLCLLLLLSLPLAGSGPAPGAGKTDSDNPALEAGLRALREGDHTMAVTLLRSSAADETGLSAEAWLGLGVAYWRLGRWGAAREAMKSSRAGLSAPLQDWVDYLRAQVCAEAGAVATSDSLLARLSGRDLPEALARRVRVEALERASAAGDSARRQAVLVDMVDHRDAGAAAAALQLGLIRAASDPDGARDCFRRGLTLPGSDEARGMCAERLLEEGASGAAELIAVGRVFFDLARWDQALEAFTRARSSTTDPALVEEAAYRRGLTLLRARRYSAARDELAAVVRTSSRYRTAAGYNAALAAAAVNRREGLRELISFAERYPQSRWAPRALKQAGDRLSGVDRAAAEEVYIRLVEDYPRHWENAGVLFDLGRNALEGGDFAGARRWFTSLGRGVFHSEEKSQGWYWAGRICAVTGDSTGARAMYRRAAEAFEDTWYGALARQALGETSVGPEPVPVFVRDALVVPEWADLDLAAGIVLLRVGLETVGEDQLLGALNDRALAPGRRIALWELCQAGQAWGAAQRLGQRLLSSGAVDRDDLLYDDLLYPVYYHDLVTETAGRSGVDPWLVFALIRQESAFDARARSYAGARGLMQLMPVTAREWAGRLRLGAIIEEDLYDPELNVALGVPYLARLIDRFDGSVEKALAAYNGGPTNVRRWERGLPDERPETFVESIGFTETRTFVRTIMNNYHRYRVLWSQRSGGQG